MSNCLWSAVLLLAVFIAVPAVVIYSLRAIVWLIGHVTGKHKLEAAEREVLQNEYLNPDWLGYKKYLLREPPPNMLLVYESPSIASHPFVTVDGEEYYLKPMHANYGLVDGVWFLGENNLGEPIFLQAGLDDGPVFKHNLGPDYEVLSVDANEFFGEAMGAFSERT